MPSRIEELQAKAGEEWSYNTVLICADDLHCLLAVVEAARDVESWLQNIEHCIPPEVVNPFFSAIAKFDENQT